MPTLSHTSFLKFFTLKKITIGILICVAIFAPIAVFRSLTIVKLSGSGTHVLALKANGTVWAWGDNDWGELGNDSKVDNSKPAQIKVITDVSAIAAGYGYSLALKNDGTVWAWGRNDMGQLGDGTTIDHFVPSQIPGLNNILAIAASAYSNYAYSLALKNDGTVWAWGNNQYGQLGERSGAKIISSQLAGEHTSINPIPGVVPGMEDYFISAIAAGELHALALTREGAVFSWGDNSYGQLGDGSTTARLVPKRIAYFDDLTGNSVIAISSELSHSLALMSDGLIYAWGKNEGGQLKDGIKLDQPTPLLVKSPGDTIPRYLSIAAGSDHSIALKDDGTVWSWGKNDNGQLGLGHTIDIATLSQVANLDDISAIAAGPSYSLALDKYRTTVWGWGHVSLLGGHSWGLTVPKSVFHSVFRFSDLLNF